MSNKTRKKAEAAKAKAEAHAEAQPNAEAVAQALAEATDTVGAVAVAEAAEATEAAEEAETIAEGANLSEEDKAILDAIKALPDGEAKQKALARFGKLKAQDDKSGQAKRFVEFDTELKVELPKFLTELAKKHNVSLVGRKITIAYPTDGTDAKHTHTPLSSRSGSGGGGNGKGFQTHGKVNYEGTEHNSLHMLADVLNLQYEGRRTAFQVFEEPMEKDTKKPLPYKFSVTRQDDGKLLVEKLAPKK